MRLDVTLMIIFQLFCYPTPQQSNLLTLDKWRLLGNKNEENAAGDIQDGEVTGKKRGVFQTYINDKNYFISTFDVNQDGLPDKVVSSAAYKGEDLFIFIGSATGVYKLALETTNFTEDGGQIIKEIRAIPGRKGIQVHTYFPDRGYYEKAFTIVPEKGTWMLEKITYKTLSGNAKNAVNYVCDVAQHIDLTKSGWLKKVNQIPEEGERSKKCKTEKPGAERKKEYVIHDHDGFTNLRNQASMKSPVLQKIKSGESVELLGKTGEWLLVRTKAGYQGYVYQSRARPIQ